MPKTHNFDQDAERRGTDARKYDPSLCAKDVIPMWIADTDFLSPQELVDEMLARVRLGHFGYPYNDSEFGKAVARWQEKRFSWNIEPEWVEFAPGAVMPLLYGMRAFTSPGDKVLLQTPAYPPLYQLITNNGRQVVRNPMQLRAGRYEIDFENLEKGLSDPRTRAMILCNPHNPTGREFSAEELKKIGELCIRYHVFILADEIHGDIVYAGRRHTPFPSVDNRFNDICCVAVNPSKTFNTAGLRTAALICPNQFVRSIILEQRLNNKAFGRPIFGALAMKVLYNQCDYYADQLVEYLEKNVKLVEEELQTIPGIQLIKPEATYLLWLDCRGLGLSQSDLMSFFTQKAKILPNDGITFGIEGEGFVRMNIACPRTTVRKAMNQLRYALC